MSPPRIALAQSDLRKMLESAEADGYAKGLHVGKLAFEETAPPSVRQGQARAADRLRRALVKAYATPEVLAAYDREALDMLSPTPPLDPKVVASMAPKCEECGHPSSDHVAGGDPLTCWAQDWCRVCSPIGTPPA